MDPTKPPTRLKVVLLSLPPRTQAVLDYFFASTGRSSFEPTAGELADAAIFDVDTLESRQHWEAYRSHSGRPGIAMSIQPQQVPGAVWVRKPITPAALLSAAAELHAGRWTPDPVTAAPAPPQAEAAAPIAAAQPAPTVAAAPVIPPFVPPTAPAMPAPAPASPAVSVAVAPVADSIPASAPAAVSIAGSTSIVAAPAVSGDATTSGQVVVRPLPASAPMTPRPAAPATARPAAPVSTPARAASAPMAPRAAASASRSEARQDTRNDARQAAARGGLGGFIKRLFGRDPEASVAPSVAAPRPAPLQATPVSRIVTPPAAPAAHESDAEFDDEDEGDEAGWHEVSGADAAAPGRPPFTPGAPKAGLGSSKAARRRGRKVTTRWVDLGAAAPSHADAHADTVVVEAVVVGAADPVTPVTAGAPEAGPAAETLTPPDAATVAVTAAVAAMAEAVAADRLAEASAEPATADAPATVDVGTATAPAEAPRLATSWRVATTPQDLAAEALYCGQHEDVSYEVLSHDVSRRYEPTLSLVGALTEAYLVAGKWRVPTQLDCSAGRIVVDTTRNRVHLGFDAEHLPSLWTTPIERRRKTQALNRQEQGALDALPPEAWQPLDRLLWRAGMLGAAGRLPEGTDLRAPVYLKHWPNLTRVQRTPHALRIAALWAIRGAGLMETAELLHIPQRHVFAFYNAALAMDLITTDGSQVKRSQRRAGRNRGLLTRLLGWLQH